MLGIVMHRKRRTALGRAIFLVAVGIASVLGVSVSAIAQESAETKAPVIRLEELKIEGRVQKPEAFYILPRSNLNYEGLEREQSFLPRVKSTLEKAPLKPE